MRSSVISRTFTVEQVDVLYVAQQINLDLQSMSRAYPTILSMTRATNLFNACTTFLHNYAVKRVGFSIFDPAQSDLVYHELRYEVLYGGQVASINPGGGRMGRGGIPIEAVWVPRTARFTAWVVWSSHMLSLSRERQRQIVSGTGWTVPNDGSSFDGTYQGGSWSSIGSYASGNIGATGKEYK